MAAGPFARIVAQFVMVAGGAVVRAVSQAYKEAAKQGGQNSTIGAAVARNRMKLDEAIKIIELDPKQATAQQIIEKCGTMVKLNEVDAKGIGSPYLQRKITIAQKICLDERIRIERKNTSTSSDEQDSASSSTASTSTSEQETSSNKKSETGSRHRSDL